MGGKFISTQFPLRVKSPYIIHNYNFYVFSLKRTVNYIDDTSTPVLRNRNINKTEGISSPRISRPSSPLGSSNSKTQTQPTSPTNLEESPKSPLKSASDKISECLYSGEIVDIEKLKKLAWNGIPFEFRPLCWKILMVTQTN